MPFCRKCGRRLPPYSESCPECKTSTTASIIKIKGPAAAQAFKAAPKTKIARAVIPAAEITVAVKTFAQAKPAATKPAKAAKTFPTAKPLPQPKTATPAKPAAPAESLFKPKPARPIEEPPKHEIKQTELSLEEDIITNPRDYETQTFDFDLECIHDHFFPAGSTLPVSKNRAYCPICGEQLRKPEHKKRRRYRKF